MWKESDSLHCGAVTDESCRTTSGSRSVLTNFLFSTKTVVRFVLMLNFTTSPSRFRNRSSSPEMSKQNKAGGEGGVSGWERTGHVVTAAICDAAWELF